VNPRVALWLHVHDLPASSVARTPEDEVACTADPATQAALPWTLAYSAWVRGQWSVWARELGYVRGDGRGNHEAALRDGHTSGHFDAWLTRTHGGRS